MLPNQLDKLKAGPFNVVPSTEDTSNVVEATPSMNIDEADENGFAIIWYDKNKPKLGDFIVVKFATEKQFKHFVGMISRWKLL